MASMSARSSNSFCRALGVPLPLSSRANRSSTSRCCVSSNSIAFIVFVLLVTRIASDGPEGDEARDLLVESHMAILQAILTMISRSAGKILNAVFGWAVRALFGQPSPKEQPFLTGVVAAAAAWPVLLLGVAFPRIAALLLAFVPFHNRAPAWLIRVIWLG